MTKEGNVFSWLPDMIEKCHVPSKNPLRVPGLIRKYPFTGGAEAPTGRQTGQRRQAKATRRNKNREIEQAGVPQRKEAPRPILVSPLFEIAGD